SAVRRRRFAEPAPPPGGRRPCRDRRLPSWLPAPSAETTSLAVAKLTAWIHVNQRALPCMHPNRRSRGRFGVNSVRLLPSGSDTPKLSSLSAEATDLWLRGSGRPRLPPRTNAEHGKAPSRQAGCCVAN